MYVSIAVEIRGAIYWSQYETQPQIQSIDPPSKIWKYKWSIINKTSESKFQKDPPDGAAVLLSNKMA